MIDRDELRRKKQEECDAYVEQLHRMEPELAQISQKIGQLSLRLIRKGILQKNLAEKQAIDMQVQQLLQRRKEILGKYGLGEEVYEPKWDCPLCKDLGYITPGEPCECLKKERILQRKEESGLPRGLWEKNFENFDTSYYKDMYKIQEIVAYCRAFANQVATTGYGNNLVLLGDVGRGKTHLSVAIATEVLERGKRVFYTRVDEMIDLIRAAKFDGLQEEKMRFLKECDLLVLDDLGAENSSEFAINQLRIVLEERNLAGKSWIINSNLSLEKIEALYTSRVADRILEKGKVFQLTSDESIRLILRKDYM